MVMLKNLGDNIKILLEEAEGKELICQVQSNRLSIYPRNQSGSPVDDISARPTIEIRYDLTNNLLVLSWIYLVSMHSGIGSRVIELIIEFCNVNNIYFFSINSVHQDNKAMFALGNKYKMKKLSASELNYYNLFLDLS